MTSPPRNANLSSGALTQAGTWLLYTVPTGYTTILKFAQLIMETAPPVVYSMLGISALSGSYMIILDGTYETTRWFTLNGWVAFNSGDKIQCYVAKPTGRVWLAGAVLPYASGISGAPPTLPQVPTFVSTERFPGADPLPAPTP